MAGGRVVTPLARAMQQKNAIPCQLYRQEGPQYPVRISWPKAVRATIAKNQDSRCKHCNVMFNRDRNRFYDIDHIKALMNGGEDNVENLQALCLNCPGLKPSLKE